MDDGLKLLQDVDKLIELGIEGYALVTEIDVAEKQVKEFLNSNIDKDSLLWRKFDKWNSGPHWKKLYSHKYAVRSQLEYLESLREFLTELIEQSAVPIPKDQEWVKAGATYTGSRILREGLLTANKQIDIQDNYVGIRLLNILEQCLLEKPGLKIRLLTKDGNYKDLKPFIQEFPIFQKQFPNSELKSHDQAHGRFFIIDGSKAYYPGASLKNMGSKADLYSEITEDSARQSAIKDFESWWTSGTDGVRMK